MLDQVGTFLTIHYGYLLYLQFLLHGVNDMEAYNLCKKLGREYPLLTFWSKLFYSFIKVND